MFKIIPGSPEIFRPNQLFIEVQKLCDTKRVRGGVTLSYPYARALKSVPWTGELTKYALRSLWTVLEALEICATVVVLTVNVDRETCGHCRRNRFGDAPYIEAGEPFSSATKFSDYTELVWSFSN